MKTKIYIFTAMILLAGILINYKVHATTHQVTVSDHVFTPSNLNVTVGDTITWIWVSGTHTTTSTGIPASAASWDQPINSSSTTYSYKVTVAGSYNYQCSYHYSMGMIASFTASNPNNTLAVSPSNQNVSWAAGSTSFTVTSNTSWNANCNMSWCSCTPSGTGNGTITVTYSQNASTTQRVATVTITASGVSDVMVTVTQAGAAPTLTVTPSAQNVSQAAGITNFSVTSNTNWTASSDQTWCLVTSSGNGNGSITATYQANSSNAPRSAMITVTVTGLPDQMVMVNQDAALGMYDPAVETFVIYPNPVISSLNISSETLKTSTEEISIYDINSLKVLGPLTISGSPASVDLSNLPDGVYFIRIGKDNTGKVQKIIKTQ